MTKQEFETLAGYEVSREDYYNIIEPMYMAIEADKVDFVNMISKKRFALPTLGYYKKEMLKRMDELESTCTFYHDEKTRDELAGIIEKYIARRFFPRNVKYLIDEKMKQSCYFPYRITIYDGKTYETLEVIEGRKS